MGKSRDTIDYLDLYVPIAAALQEPFKSFVDDFMDRHTYIEINPRLKDRVLMINSTDLISFTGYIRPADCNELDLFRFKMDAKKLLEQQLVKSLSLNAQAHYKWCLGSLVNKEFGRYLEEEPESA